ncbi:Integrase core domain protein [Photorhabdus australis subsp. thailandensis]|uniref:Integrase core domain protein n=2 Tax=Photorhabdus australis TaxID=286156 RepID=A0A1C0U004_9GAMM|nr:IS3 family transposase [Photorhabdus australis]OCQ51234.1 Integrase core domain protein [Photorhabdus australis subsp. thailandensis]
MKECGLISRQPGGHRYRICPEESVASPNRVRREFIPGEPNTLWCGDISYIRTGKGGSYLAVVMDLYSRRVVGWAMSSTADAELVCRALRHALEMRAGKASGISF